jgi:serine/threonine protein kinase
VKILKMVKQPHIVALLDIYYTANNCYMVMEYCEGGSLQARIDTKEEINWAKAAHEVGMACRYLASLNIMHRDIKPANVFIKEGACKLGDFGFAHQLGGVD